MTEGLTGIAHSRLNRTLRGASMAAIAVGSLSFAAPNAWAQDATQDPPAAEATLTGPTQPGQDASVPQGSEIIVTGSRLGEGFTAPTPLTVVGQEQVQDRAIASVAELNYEVPQLRINQNIGRSSEPVGQNQLDLRALGSARTLVLLDGRRMAATSPFGGIDSNVFPVALLSSVEVVTGGASAAYGSDAVAGVINFGLVKDFEGFKLDASYGVSRYGDYNRPVISAAAGTSLMDNRLHVEVAGDFYRNTGQTRAATRKWARGRPIMFANPNYTPTNGQTKNYIAYDAGLMASFGGLITGVNADTNPGNGADVLRGIQFGANGSVDPFNYGSIQNSTWMLGGDGASVEDDGNLLPHITRYSGYGRMSYDVSNSVSAWADLLYSRVEVTSDLAPNYDLGSSALTIYSDNAYLPTSVRNTMLANGISSFRLSRVNLEDGFSENNSSTEVLRYAAGLEGSFGDGWNWDFFVQRSDNHFYQESVNNRNQAKWRAGVDAVIDPATGRPACRVNVDSNPANNMPGCAPIDVFGPGSINGAALDWYRGTSFYDSHMTQNVVGLNLRGRPFSTWAGDVSVAVGAEYRREEIDSVSDPVSMASGWRSINQQPFSGDLTVKEAYLETAIPLLDHSSVGYNLEFNGAIRYADYSSSGGVTTWKVGLNYSPIQDIRFRGTISRDIRAANINELYSGQNQVINTLNDPRSTAPAPAYFVLQLTGGNPNLDPEKGDTKAVGVVISPSFIPGLDLSIDYYNIKIDNAITSVPPQTIVNNCFVQNISQFCSLIAVDSTTNLISSVQATIVNAQTIKTSGIDFEMSYRRPIGSGTLGTRLLVNYVNDLSLTASGVSTDYVGDLATDYSGQPRWKANFDLTWRDGPLKLGAYVRYIGGGKYRSYYIDDVDLPADENNVSGQTYVDISGSYRVTDWLEIYGKVDNLFDRDPPILPNAIVQPTVANSQMFDKIGRYYVGGVRMRF